MEDKRERLSVIIAGYTKKMRELIKANEGLESRFTRELVFPDYNAAELKQIFLMFCKEASLIVAPSADPSLDHAMSMFDGYRTDTFGNGRAARNFLEEVVKKQAARVIGASEASDPMEIQTSDIEQALEKVMGQMNAGQAKQLGFHTSA
jgi:Cdc6-like AAA superfamily ATPase